MTDNNNKDVPRLRDVRIKISDNDLKELGVVCGQTGITIQRLFEVLVGDLTCDNGLSGSDGTDLAKRWMKSHTLTNDSENTHLLKFVIKHHGIYGVDKLITSWDQKKSYEADPIQYAKSMGLGDTSVRQLWNDDIAKLTEGYEGTIDDAAINDLETWLKEYQKISI